MNWKLKLLITVGSSFLGLLIAFWIWWGHWVNYSANYQYPYIFDKYTGQIEPLPNTGYKILTPWHYNFHTIDLRPRLVCINANNRVVNCKLVSFNLAGFKQFMRS